MFVNYSSEETPFPREEWVSLSPIERLKLVCSIFEQFEKYTNLAVIDCKSNGEVFVELKNPLPSNQRGTLLLDAEWVLKKQVDEAITVWLEPLGDKSTLRNLRGIKVKITRDDSSRNQNEGEPRD